MIKIAIAGTGYVGLSNANNPRVGQLQSFERSGNNETHKGQGSVNQNKDVTPVR